MADNWLTDFMGALSKNVTPHQRAIPPKVSKKIAKKVGQGVNDLTAAVKKDVDAFTNPQPWDMEDDQGNIVRRATTIQDQAEAAFNIATGVYGGSALKTGKIGARPNKNQVQAFIPVDEKKGAEINKRAVPRDVEGYHAQERYVGQNRGKKTDRALLEKEGVIARPRYNPATGQIDVKNPIWNDFVDTNDVPWDVRTLRDRSQGSKIHKFPDAEHPELLFEGKIGDVVEGTKIAEKLRERGVYDWVANQDYAVAPYTKNKMSPSYYRRYKLDPQTKQPFIDPETGQYAEWGGHGMYLPDHVNLKKAGKHEFQHLLDEAFGLEPGADVPNPKSWADQTQYWQNPAEQVARRAEQSKNSLIIQNDPLIKHRKFQNSDTAEALRQAFPSYRRLTDQQIMEAIKR